MICNLGVMFATAFDHVNVHRLTIKEISRLLTLQLEPLLKSMFDEFFSIQMPHCLTGVRHVWSDPSQLLEGTLLTSKVFNVLLHFVGKMLTTRPFRDKNKKALKKSIQTLF